MIGKVRLPRKTVSRSLAPELLWPVEKQRDFLVKIPTVTTLGKTGDDRISNGVTVGF
jgi:hypothetical protein